MKNVSTIGANAIVISTIIALLILQSCDVGEPFQAASTVQTPEVNTPTGCLKSKGRYYDPKIKECVQVTDQHQALVLNAYRYVNQLAEKNAGELEYRIYLKKYLTADAAEILWADLRDHGAKLTLLAGVLPGDRVYDPILEWNQEALDEELKWQKEHNSLPRVWGTGSSEGCGWYGTNPPVDKINDLILLGLKMQEEERPRPELHKAIQDDGDCRIEEFIVIADAKVMLEWVNRHLDDLEGVQPVVDYIDKNMPALGPVQALKEGE